MCSNKRNLHLFDIRKLLVLALLFFCLGEKVFAADPTITFQIGEQKYAGDSSPFVVPESARLVELVAVLSEPQASEVSFTYTLFQLGTTATRLSDFQFNLDDDPSQRQNTVEVTFQIGETLLPIPIVISNDFIKEDDEVIRFNMAMTSPGVSLKNEDIYIKISDDEAAPIIVLSAGELPRDPITDEINAAVDEGAGILLTLEIINNASSKDIEVTYEITYTPVPTKGEEDYNISDSQRIDDTRGILTINALETERDFSIFIKIDSIPEEQELLRIELISASNGAVVHSPANPDKGPQTIVNLTINDIDGNAGAINDTGVTRCYNTNKEILSGCSSSEFPEQDGDNVDVDRLNRYVKLNGNGNPLDISATEWACVLDENTNLVWQVKATDTDFNIGDTSAYTWFNPIEHVNGGNEGFSGTGAGIDEDPGSASCTSGVCNTNAYRSRVSSSLCGKGNWRLPSLTELLSIIDFEPDITNNNITVTDISYFKHTLPNFYWTSTPASVVNSSAWCVYFGKVLKNHARLCEKEVPHFVRLVKTYNPD